MHYLVTNSRPKTYEALQRDREARQELEAAKDASDDESEPDSPDTGKGPAGLRIRITNKFLTSYLYICPSPSVSTPISSRNCPFCSICRSLQDSHPFAPLEAHCAPLESQMEKSRFKRTHARTRPYNLSATKSNVKKMKNLMLRRVIT